ncbi:MAG TPA: nuclear transport factor 2 family protein [Jatrophihabitans sp.]|jgi:ketosteroid isomerase-like protein
MTDALAAVRLLLDEREITAVLHRRARATDQRDLDAALSCYHDDASEDHEGFDGPIREYLATTSPVFVGGSDIVVNFHQIGNVEIQVDSDRARCQCYFLCAITEGSGPGARDYLNAGRYLDDFERRDGVWRIAHRQCVYEWSHGEPLTDRWWTRAAYGRRTEPTSPASA